MRLPGKSAFARLHWKYHPKTATVQVLVGPRGAAIVGPRGVAIVGARGVAIVGPRGVAIVGPRGAAIVGHPFSSHSIRDFTIVVTDVNDNPPIITTGHSACIDILEVSTCLL